MYKKVSNILCVAAFIGAMSLNSQTALAQAPVPTLDRVKTEQTTFLKGTHQSYALTELTGDATAPEGSITVNINDKTYYYTPTDNAEVLQSLASTGSVALEVTTDPSKALYSVGDTYYTYNPDKLKGSGYNLTEAASADEPNTITLYDKTEIIKYYDPTTGAEVAEADRQEGVEYKEVTTIETTPKYYTVNLNQTVYGDAAASGAVAHYYKWTNDSTGVKLESTSDAAQANITYWEDPSKTAASRITSDQSGADINNNFIGLWAPAFNGGAIYNYEGIIGDITGDFIGNYASSTTSSSVYGGAIYNSGTIGDITGDFIGNYAYSAGTGIYSDAEGGAIYNSGTNAEIGDITGDFIGNYASSTSSSAQGGAICNRGTIGDITGDFIGNYALSTDSYAYGGAIYNTGTIDDITGDFIGNYATANSSAGGGAIENNGTIGDITGDFIGNYASSTDSSAYGGAIYNTGTIDDITGDFIGNYATANSSAGGGAIDNNGTIGDITGDFIGNYATGSYQVYGGAICNDYNSTIGDITGDFIGNYAISENDYANGGAIYNTVTIGDITGDFIGNYASSTDEDANGGAIYNTGTIGDITGDFIGNYASSTTRDAYGGAIYNYEGTIGDITGDFIGNYASSIDGSANGGAIDNSETIGNITGDFIGNYASASGSYSSAAGGAIYNDDDAEIGDITGDFIGNYASSTSSSAYGGAIYNDDDAEIGDITGDFIGNYASSTSSSAYGGAIYNSGTNAEIGDITGDFIGNYVTANSSAKGGAIVNAETIGNITGDFIGNYASASYARGGAIYNEGTIGDITGDFIGNYAISENDYAIGGAIDNARTIGNITGDFIGNYASGNTYANGGAIYNQYGTIGNITGDFIGNYAYSTSGYAIGGAIANMGTIMGYDVSSDKIYDISQLAYKVTNPNTGESFVLYGLNDAEIQETNALLEQGYKIVCNPINYPQMTPEEWAEFEQELNAYIESGEFRTELPFGDDAFAKESGSFINSSFINNYAASKTGNAVGGAIFSTNNINIVADNGQSIFSGNKTISNGKEEQNAIGMYGFYVSEELSQEEGIPAGFLDPLTGSTSNKNPANLTLEAKNNGVIVFDDTIRGGAWDYEAFDNQRLEVIETPETAFDLKVTGDSTGKVILNNDVINANISLDNTNLYLGREDVFDKSVSLSLNSGSIYLNNQSVGTMHIPTLNLNGNTNLSVDVDLANKSMDRITADNYNVKDNAMLNVNNIVLLSDAKEDKTDILFADEGLASNVAYTGASPIAYTPIYKYEVSYNPDDGFFTFARSAGSSGPNGNISDAYNPAVLASPVAQQAGAYTTQLQAFNYAFQHADTFMNIPYLERVAIINSGKYALSPTGDATDVGTYSPLMIKQHDPGFWVKPYASFENVPLKNGPKVSNINYGTLIGYDTPIKEISNGFERVLTGYIGYNGASQRYQGVDAYQNGGLIGGTATFYKGNFFNATTLSVGATAGDASTMYGSENYTMLLAGIGNKTGYNFEFWDGKMILQPNFLISYTFVNTFDYNNAAGVRIESDPLHAIQLSPGLKLIGNTKNGWQPYIGVNMVWNLLDDSRVTANDVRLPEMSIRPYVQYGVGVQKRFKDKFLAFGQAMIHNGGRNGVSLTAGLRWKVGRE